MNSDDLYEGINWCLEDNNLKNLKKIVIYCNAKFDNSCIVSSIANYMRALFKIFKIMSYDTLIKNLSVIILCGGEKVKADYKQNTKL